MFTEIAPSVFAFGHRLVDGKNAIVFGQRGALAIDACMYAEDGDAMATFIRHRGALPNRLALTHAHHDHILGSAAFRDADVYAHVEAPRTVERHFPTWVSRYFNGSPEATEAAITRPNVVFDGELRIDLGGKTALMFSTPGHSPDSACILLEEDRVLCAGDTVVTNIVPAITDGDSTVLEATLRKLATLDLDLVVPGHGRLLEGRAAIQEHLAWMMDYLSGVRRFVEAALDRGETSEAIVESTSFARFVSERLPEEPHGMLRRHRMVVEKVIEEVMQARAARGQTPARIDAQ